MTTTNNPERFTLNCNGRTFDKYLIDTDGNLWDAATGASVPWQRPAHAELSMGSKSRSATAGQRWLSKLVADDGSLVTVGKAEAVAWSVPEVAAGRKPGDVVVFQDGNRANEFASNLSWGPPHEMLAKLNATRPEKTGSNSHQILSVEDVKEILANYNPHDQSNNSRAFADKFGVAQTTINNVISYKTFPRVDRKPYASNPYIEQENYFDTYVPGEGTQMYEDYIRLGKLKPKATTETNANTIAPETAQVSNRTESAPVLEPIPVIAQPVEETIQTYGVFNPDDD